MCFDANGNLMTETPVNPCPPAAPTYAYDAENRLVNYMGSSAVYTYDGNGLRVKKVTASATTVYVFSGSKVIAEYDNGAVPGSPSREYIYSGAALLAKIEGIATVYYHEDHLSNRVLTDSSGNLIGQRGHYPFGDTWYESGTTTKLAFTTYERDSESTNDYALARNYINRFGRFGSPDPLSGSASNPQSLNRYAYVGNTPVTLTDTTGLGKDCLILKNFSSDAYDVAGGYSDGDDFALEPDPPSGCGGGGGGGGGCPTMTIDGGIVDCSTSPDTGFPIGGGNPSDILNSDVTISTVSYWSNGEWVELDDPLSVLSLFGQEPPPDLPNPPLPPFNPNLVPIKPPPLPLECRPEFIAQAKAAWERAGYGFRDTEAGFMMRGSWSSPTYIPFPFTNEHRAISFREQPNDVAFFHTHPNSGSPFPSDPPAVDKGYHRPGDGAYVIGYTASRTGLYMSDPTAKNGYVQVRNGLDWLNPCL